MNINQLTTTELQQNLQRLHSYLNDKYFGGELADVCVLIGENGSQMDGYVIRYGLPEVIRVQRMKLPDALSVERYQFRWMLSTMLHSMIDQYKAEGGEDSPEDIAECVGLIEYGLRTEWINPLRLAFIEQDFQLRHGA